MLKWHQEGEITLGMPEDQDQSSDMVRVMPKDQQHSFDMLMVRYINLNSVKSLLFTKSESSTSQRCTKITYKINSTVDGNLMPFQKLQQNFYVQQRTTQ